MNVRFHSIVVCQDMFGIVSCYCLNPVWSLQLCIFFSSQYTFDLEFKIVEGLFLLLFLLLFPSIIFMFSQCCGTLLSLKSGNEPAFSTHLVGAYHLYHL